MKLIETKTLTGTAASIEFTSIPQTFTDLVLVFSLRSNTGTGDYVIVSFNSNTTGYVARELAGSGSTVASSAYTTGAAARIFAYAMGNDATANTFCNSQTYVPNYSGSVNKTWSSEGVMENNAVGSTQSLVRGTWSNTAAITSMTFIPFVGTTWLANSTVSLYGITSGSDGIVTVA